MYQHQKKASEVCEESEEVEDPESSSYESDEDYDVMETTPQ